MDLSDISLVFGQKCAKFQLVHGFTWKFDALVENLLKNRQNAYVNDEKSCISWNSAQKTPKCINSMWVPDVINDVYPIWSHL